MLENLAIGSGLVVLTVLIHTVGLILVAAAIPPLARRLGLQNHGIGRTLAMTGTVLGILGLLTLEVWSWAIAYVRLGAVRDLSDGLFLSTAMFSTLGYGELQIVPAWRLLTALEGVNGFLMIGWSTAFLVSAATRHGPFRQGEHF